MLRKYGLLGAYKFTDDEANKKYDEGMKMHILDRITSLKALGIDFVAQEIVVELRDATPEGKGHFRGCDWSPTLLQTECSQLVVVKKRLDLNFFTKSNADLVVHKHDYCL